MLKEFYTLCMNQFNQPRLFLGLHLVLLPKDDDPSKAVLATCSEKELIRLAINKMQNNEKGHSSTTPTSTTSTSTGGNTGGMLLQIISHVLNNSRYPI